MGLMTRVAGLMIVACGIAGAAYGQDYGNIQDVVTSGLSSPVGLYAAPGDNSRLFVVENGGRIRVINVTEPTPGNKVYSLAATPFLDLGALDSSNPYFRTAGGAPLTDSSGTIIPRLTRSGGTGILNNGNTYPVTRYNEQGLLGLAFAPDYQTSRKFYIYYVQSSATTTGAINWSFSGTSAANFNATDVGRTVIFEFMRDANNASIADTSTEKLIWRVDQPYVNHNGGTIIFGRDGYLYAGPGDGGSGGDPGDRALNPNSQLGKLIRIDPSSDAYPADPLKNYAIPSDNPYATAGGAPEVWARGLRNPWRWSFDRWNGDLWIADVGQNLWEEINHVSGNGGPNLNYGWRVREGMFAYTSSSYPSSPRIDPVYNYPHSATQANTNSNWIASQAGFSTVGGYVYRGNAIRPWRGKYIFSDTYGNQVWAFNADVTPGAATPAAVGLETWTTLLRTTINGVTPTAISNVVAFGEDNEGELFIVQIGGRIRKIVPQGTQPPISDMGVQGGLPGADGQWDNNDFVAFIDLFFNNDPRADVGVQGGIAGVDQMLDNNDFIVFIDKFFLQQ